jgi:hypothetical protein
MGCGDDHSPRRVRQYAGSAHTLRTHRDPWCLGRRRRSVEADDAIRRFRHDLNFGQTGHDPVLKRYRKDLLDALAAAGVAEQDVAVASVFTTQSVTAMLEAVRDQIPLGTPSAADFVSIRIPSPVRCRQPFPLTPCRRPRPRSRRERKSSGREGRCPSAVLRRAAIRRGTVPS